jgi:hypothetical protein
MQMLELQHCLYVEAGNADLEAPILDISQNCTGKDGVVAQVHAEEDLS